MEKEVTKKVLYLLRDDKEYYTGLGKQFLSNSDIGTLLKDPKNFGVGLEESKTLILGRYFHCLILEPEKASDFKVFDGKVRRGKEYENFLANNNVEFCLLTSEEEKVRGWVDTMLSNIDFHEMIHDNNNLYEEPQVKEIHGELWKGKADIVTKDFVLDLKTSSDITSFRKSVYNFNYDSQAFIYQQLFGKPLKFLVIDKNTYMLGVYELKPETLARGEEKVIQAVEQYRKFFGEKPTHDINQYYHHEII